MRDMTVDGGTVKRPDHARLFEIASERGGYFTAGQAVEAGFGWSLLAHHTDTGRFRRIHRGLYRFRDFPAGTRDDVLEAWMSVGMDDAVVSHASALDLLGLSDAIPDAVHITVSRNRRHQRVRPGIRLHTVVSPIRIEDRTWRNGCAVTTPLRTILDMLVSGDAPDHLDDAIRQAVMRGLVSAEALRARAETLGRRATACIHHSLEAARR